MSLSRTSLFLELLCYYSWILRVYSAKIGWKKVSENLLKLCTEMLERFSFIQWTYFTFLPIGLLLEWGTISTNVFRGNLWRILVGYNLHDNSRVSRKRHLLCILIDEFFFYMLPLLINALISCLFYNLSVSQIFDIFGKKVTALCSPSFRKIMPYVQIIL